MKHRDKFLTMDAHKEEVKRSECYKTYLKG